MSNKPLTAADLADALGCFSNHAIHAMHSGSHAVACVAAGIDAVVWRLQEIAETNAPYAPAEPLKGDGK